MLKGVHAMNWFINLSTRVKLIIGFGIIWLLLAVVILIAYRNITVIAGSGQEMHDVQFTVALELIQLRSNQNYNRSQMLEMMLTTDKSKIKKIEEDITQRGQQIDESIENLLKLKLEDSYMTLLTELKNNLTAYRETRKEEISLIKGGNIEEARQLAISTQDERFNEIRSLAIELGDMADKDVDNQITRNMNAAVKEKIIFVLIGIAAILLGGFMIFILNRTMAEPLSEIAGIAGAIAEGDLNVTLKATDRNDEVGILLQTFSRMTGSLRNIADVAMKIAAGDLRSDVKPQNEKDILGNAFSRMIANLRSMTADINEAVTQLGSSASEILASTTQVASGTSETATAISETTTTVEEVRQAAQLSSRKAQNLSDNAEKVVQVSRAGQKAVEETAEGMRHIRKQMESIAATIVSLSEQGQSIGGIIATVADLADQSNLLAVNAAIEAAGAGEQGKRFGVVAQEIRNLAEQSKQATAQVRDILNDLQKATSAAVMATEQGNKAVDAGVKQSVQAGDAILASSKSTEETMQAAIQIVASSRQQEVGMDQIGTAMENINQAGAETVASMRQTEEAAKNLHELGQKLKDMVEQFKV
jgi:methyl-accepting chemotaxis protein